MEQPDAFRLALGEVDELVAAFERHPDERVRSLVTALLVAVDKVHRIGLNRLVTGLKLRGSDWVLDQLREDPTVSILLALYDLAPLSIAEAGPVRPTGDGGGPGEAPEQAEQAAGEPEP